MSNLKSVSSGCVGGYDHGDGESHGFTPAHRRVPELLRSGECDGLTEPLKYDAYQQCGGINTELQQETRFMKKKQSVLYCKPSSRPRNQKLNTFYGNSTIF